MYAFHTGFVILAFLCQIAISLPGCLSISSPLRWQMNNVPPCFCDPIGPETSTGIKISCTPGSVHNDLKNAASIVEAAETNVRQVFISLMDFGEGLEANFFEGFHSLGNITIFECWRQEALYIDNDTFKRLERSLEELRILDCTLENIPHAVRNLTTLKTLFLRGSEISELFADDFVGLTELQNLDLAENRMFGMHPLCFKPLKNLQTLVLGPRNRLNESSFEAINHLSLLEMLDIQGSQIDVLPVGAFKGLSNLEYLYMQRNNLANLTSGIFDGLSSLKHLDLTLNLIKEVESGTFNELKELKTLLLAGNFISQIDAHFKGLGKLEKLDIGWNEFKSLGPNIFANLENLTVLDIRHNKQLSKIDVHAFSSLDKLERLNLSETKIGLLMNGQLEPLGSLKYLDLSNTTLHEVHNDSFVSVPQLKELCLKNNNLSSLSPTVFDSVPLLELLDISGNPWNCNGILWGLVEFLQYKYNDSMSYVNDSINTLCDKPKRLKGRMLVYLTEQMLQSEEETTTVSSDATDDEDSIVNAKLKQLHEELGNFIETGNPVCKNEAIQYVEPLLNFLNQTYERDPDSLLC